MQQIPDIHIELIGKNKEDFSLDEWTKLWENHESIHYRATFLLNRKSASQQFWMPETQTTDKIFYFVPKH